MGRLPNDHTRTLELTINLRQFRELMRSVAYRAADHERTDPALSTQLNEIVTLVGDAWEAGEVVRGSKAAAPEPHPLDGLRDTLAAETARYERETQAARTKAEADYRAGEGHQEP